MILFLLDHTADLTKKCLKHLGENRYITRSAQATAEKFITAEGKLMCYISKPEFDMEFREQVTHLYALGMITIIPEMSDPFWKTIVDLKPTFDAALRTSILATPVSDILACKGAATAHARPHAALARS